MSVPVFSRAAVLEAVTPHDAYGAVRNAFLAHHSGEWAMATLEVCLAILESSRTGREVALAHQVALPKGSTKGLPC